MTQLTKSSPGEIVARILDPLAFADHNSSVGPRGLETADPTTVRTTYEARARAATAKAEKCLKALQEQGYILVSPAQLGQPIDLSSAQNSAPVSLGNVLAKL